MKLIHTGHCGIYLQAEHSPVAIYIDPWLIGSHMQKPILEGIMPGEQSIDFLLPPPSYRPEDFAPNAVIVSHFHAHHAPKVEISYFASKFPGMALLCPRLSPSSLARLSERESLGHGKNVFCQGPGDFYEIGPFKITCFHHPYPEHAVWGIECEGQKILHLADACWGLDQGEKLTESKWRACAEFQPDWLFISCGGHSWAVEIRGEREILENQTLNPIQAARLTAFINPKKVILMGLHHHSHWKNRVEYILPAALAEDQFSWALSALGADRLLGLRSVNLRESEAL